MLKKVLTEMHFDKRYILFLENLDLIPDWFFDYTNFTESKMFLPPAFIPTMDSYEAGLDQKGIIKHWFTNREIIYTTVYIEMCTYYLEEARTFETFMTRVFLDWIMIEEEITQDMEKLAEIVNYNRLEEIYEFTEKYGDNPDKITQLKYFNRLSVSLPNITPFEYVQSLPHYTGDFPTSSKGFVNIKGIETATTFEIQDAAKPIVERLDNLPEWLKKDANQKYLFDKYIEKNELDKAWLTLNSTGWKLTDVANGLELLTTKTDEKGFDAMVEYWMHNWKNSYFYKEILEY
jgi:hypothetical protein